MNKDVTSIMLKRIALAVSLATMLVLPACNKSNEPAPQTVAASGVKFQLEASTDEDFLKALTYDENNTYQISGITSYRLLAGETKKSHVLVFSRPTNQVYAKASLVGYVELPWKFSKSDAGNIKASCYGTYKVHPASINGYASTEADDVILIDRSKEITLSTGNTYSFVGVVSDGPLETKIPTGGYTGYVGPSVSFDSERFSELQGESLLKSMQGDIPYTFKLDLVPKKENLIADKSGGVINIGTTVMRVEIDNQSGRILTNKDIRFNFVGLTSRIKYAFMHTDMQPRLAVKTPYSATGSLTPNSFTLPISGIPSGNKGVYFFPVSLSNGDANLVYLTKVEIKVDSPQQDISILSSNTNTPFKYHLDGSQAIRTAWLNDVQKKLKVIKLTVRKQE